MNKKILHIDFDSFFASCEQQFNPKLRNKPIGVTATNGRTCIIASSCEAKKLGIKTGCRTFEAKKIYPQIQFIPADFVKYLKISKKFLNICKDYSPFVELFSIDEVFMDVTKTSHLFGNVYSIAHIIKKRVKEEIGEYITISIGISHNKLLAKLASSINKPNGLFEIKPGDIHKVYKTVKLTDVCGIGERIKVRLNKLGIYNLLDLKFANINMLKVEFGEVYSQILKNIGMGEDSNPVIPYTDPTEVKSIGRNYCLPKNECNQRVILQNIYELCEEVGIKLRRLNRKARTIGVSLKGSNNIGGRKTYKSYFDTGKEIFDLSLDILNPQLSNVNYIRQISIWVSSLEDKKNLPSSLFDSLLRNDQLILAVDKLNEKFGDHTIRRGYLLYANKLTTVPNGYMADKYERVKISSSLE